MPLPFLKNNRSNVAGLIIQRRAADGTPQTDPEKDNKDDGLRSCAQDLIKAVQAGNEDSVASALRAAFEILDSEPHEEGPHIESEDESEEEDK